MTTPPTSELRRGLVLLCGVAIAAAGLVALTWQAAAPRIEANVQARAEAGLAAVLGDTVFDNALAATGYRPQSPAARIAGVEHVWLARRRGEPVGVVLQAATTEGYSGRIVLLVGLTPGGEVLGVETLAHRETPGLGDFIETARSDWLMQFQGRQLGRPPAERWRMRRDGGEFDAVTGATVTARAVTGALHRALVYFDAEAQALLAGRDPDHAGGSTDLTTGPDPGLLQPNSNP
ncbi:MAG: RnfABCDGE type electron transport complex subunit G [Gammaproteobacteria bacterium]|nr:RnfABCDGE type electron transport complex subunit G [Gammaproteobacteria bacterium]